jgi:hypothetical protein
MFYFTPLQGFFSPFPHGTRSLSVITAYLALEDGPPGFRQGFPCPALLRDGSTSPVVFAYATITLFGAAFQPASTNDRICDSCREIRLSDGRPTTPFAQRPNAYTRMVWALPLSLATTRGISVDVFSCGYLDVSVHRVCSLATIEFIAEYVPITARGLPHSEIRGSSLVSSSPRLIAACCVLRRL